MMKGELPARLLLPDAVAAQPSASHRRTAGRAASPAGADQLDPEATRLFEALRSRRLELSRAQGVPPYVVASDRSLREIAVLRPKSVSDLLRVHGVGAAKAEKYGEVWLEIVSQMAGPAIAAPSQ